MFSFFFFFVIGVQIIICLEQIVQIVQTTSKKVQIIIYANVFLFFVFLKKLKDRIFFEFIYSSLAFQKILKEKSTTKLYLAKLIYR